MARDKREHARRRKVWDQSFSTKALAHYNPRITNAIAALLAVLGTNTNTSLNMTQWFDFFVFDIMEDLAFNKSSNMLVSGHESYIFNTIRTDMYNIALFAHLPWLLPFLKRTPLLNRNYLAFWTWIQAQIDERARNKPEHPDIFSSLLEAYEAGEKTTRNRYNLHGDAQLIVVAGTDSVAATLTHMFFHLAYDAGLVARLQAELDALPDLAHEHLVGVGLLDAVINETMRLHPPVPSGTQRVTPPEGMWVGERFIPGDVIVQVPSYTVFRGTRWFPCWDGGWTLTNGGTDARCFERPDEFIPERWTTRPELVRDRAVFIPFNIGKSFLVSYTTSSPPFPYVLSYLTMQGPYACVGKRLALLEIRRVTAEILWRYDVCPEPGHSASAFLDGKEDTFTTVSAPLPLIFTERVKAKTGV